MRILLTALLLTSVSTLSLADDLTDADELICSASEVVMCIEGRDCMSLLPWEIGVPQFVVVDIKGKTLATTKASGENRSTPIEEIRRDGTSIFLQGVERGRAFSIVIEELKGFMTATLARDGLTVSIFGACTDANI